MNQDSENFESLRQLLALKRHEIPAPGYFDRFPREVMARIKAGEKGGDISAENSWLQRLLSMFDVKPVFAGAFGTAVCAFLVSGVMTSERTPVLGDATPGAGRSPVASVPLPDPNASVNSLMASATNSGGSLFDGFPLDTRTVSYLPNN